MDLLDEIKYDPDFAPDLTNTPDFKADILALQFEALILLLKAKNMITENEYGAAIRHVMDDMILLREMSIDDEFLEESVKRFKTDTFLSEKD